MINSKSLGGIFLIAVAILQLILFGGWWGVYGGIYNMLAADPLTVSVGVLALFRIVGSVIVSTVIAYIFFMLGAVTFFMGRDSQQKKNHI